MRRIKARDTRTRLELASLRFRESRQGRLVLDDPKSRTSGVGVLRQEIHFVLCRETDHFGDIGQSMQVIEKGFQLAGRRNPEQGSDWLVGFIEIAMRNTARHAYEVSGRRLDPDAVELE